MVWERLSKTSVMRFYSTHFLLIRKTTYNPTMLLLKTYVAHKCIKLNWSVMDQASYFWRYTRTGLAFRKIMRFIFIGPLPSALRDRQTEHLRRHWMSAHGTLSGSMEKDHGFCSKLNGLTLFPLYFPHPILNTRGRKGIINSNLLRKSRYPKLTLTR